MSRLPIARIVALAIVTVAFAVSLRTMSLSIDGTRYFWLDDDQMISMQYARNLASGNGLVWNPGERVEGYTNPGWTIVMAALHLLPIGDAKMALAVKCVSWLLACGVVLLAERLMRQLLPNDALAVAFVVIVLALCRDLLFWAVNGFDTTLLTIGFLLVVVRLIDERTRGPRAWTYVLLGALTLIRSDAYYVWVGAAAVALGTAQDRPRVVRWLAASLILPAAHVGWRLWYYGAWLPNTYYVKASVGTARWTSAAAYLKGFVAHYGAAIAVAVAGVWRVPGSAAKWLPVPGVAGVLYVCYVGADMYGLTRFLAYFVPVLIVLAAYSTVVLIRDRLAVGAVLMAVGLSVVFQIGVNGPSQFAELASGNGIPTAGVVLAVTIRDNTPPDTTVAVVAAGVVPYFSHRPALDFMGLSDAHIAHEPPHAEAPIGHTKYDIAYTLAQQPDVLVTLWEDARGIESSAVPSRDTELIANPVFIRDYAGHTRAITTPAGALRIFVSGRSKEADHLEQWRVPNVAR